MSVNCLTREVRFCFSAVWTILGFSSVLTVHAAPGLLADAPLFATTNVKPNIMMVIDDSGSMDAETLFPTNDGALWWSTANQSYVGDEVPGHVNFNRPGSANNNYKKYIYLFPNGTGTGDRVYGDGNKDSDDHYAIPPLPQYAFARSPDYNKAYFDPTVNYDPWPDYGTTTYADIDPANAPSDPESGSGTVNLTQVIQSSSSNHVFRMFKGMKVTAGTYYKDWNNNTWQAAASDVEIPGASNTDNKDVPIRYSPATYYLIASNGTYSVQDGTTTIPGDCSNPRPAHYKFFHAQPGDFSSSNPDIVALGPDGACLEEHTISASDPDMQNFANWFSYYRKRHLALRAGMASAFLGMSGIRTGVFTINNRNTVDMLDFDTESDTFFAKLYAIDGNSGGTPNRDALKHAGEQFMRTDADAPITESCQKNFAIQFTDGYSTLSGSGAGNADGNKGAPYADGYDNTLADFAMQYYSQNLRPDITPAGDVPTPGGCSVSPVPEHLDCNSDLHLNTITVGLGARGTIFGKTHFEVADAYANPPTWPDVNTERDPRQIDDLYHAAVNGRGEMLNADTPAELKDKMKDALETIMAQTGAASAVTFNSGELTADSNVYLALFNSANWSGDLFSYNLDANNGDITTVNWSAADKLDNRTSDRTILTLGATDGVPFRWDQLTLAQQSDLCSGAAGCLDDNGTPNDTSDDSISGNLDMAQARLDYLRGDRSNELSGYEFRPRSSRLGDIVHSSPIFVGPAAVGWPDEAPFPTGNPYSSFVNATQNRTPVVYTGANDGMLHGFNARTGEEVLAYIPARLFNSASEQGLHALTESDYHHRYYVDLMPTVSDAYIRTTSASGRAWHTLLIGGLRGGGRGLFALDITDPSRFAEANAADIVMWEFTDADDPDLGHTFSSPTIGLMNNGEWAAIFGNGYFEPGDSGSGEATLFIVFLEGGLDGVWSEGVDYIKLTTGVGDSVDHNGLATPGVISLTDAGTVDRVYAGDLRGNLWAFDVSSSNPGSWTLDYKLFSRSSQPITTEPMIVDHPTVTTDSNNEPNVLVLFGTGQYLVEGDKTTTGTQSFYGVWDSGTAPLQRSDLQEQTFEVGFASDVRVVTDLCVPYEPSVNGCNGLKSFGWYIDLPIGGERVVVDPIVRGDIVYFNTHIPSTAPCEYGGSGWLMSVAYENGGRPDSTPFDLNNDEVVNADDLVTNMDNSLTDVAATGQAFDLGLPAASSVLGNKQYTPGTKPPPGGDAKDAVSSRKLEDLGLDLEGRLSWEEMLNP